VNTPSILWPRVEHSDGRILAVVDSLIFVFFLDREQCADPGPANEAFARFVNGVGRGVLRFYVDEDGNTPPLPADPLPFIQRTIATATRSGEHCELTLIDHEEGGNRGEAEYLHNPDVDLERWPDKRSVIWFRLGAPRVLEIGLEAVENFARSLCDVLPYTSGYVSPSLSYGEFIRHVHRFVHRYPGFDVARPTAAAWDIGDRPLGAYWLNFFGPRLVEALGGADGIRAVLQAPIEVSACGSGGAAVKLGDTPEVGDINAGRDLPLHRMLAEFLEPHLRVPEMKYMHDRDGMNDEDFQRAWHRRFLKP
jgi:hypothetical protein